MEISDLKEGSLYADPIRSWVIFPKKHLLLESLCWGFSTDGPNVRASQFDTEIKDSLPKFKKQLGQDVSYIEKGQIFLITKIEHYVSKETGERGIYLLKILSHKTLGWIWVFNGKIFHMKKIM